MNKKHIIFYSILRPPVIVFLKCKFGYKYRKAKNLPEKYIVLSNHTTDYDPLLVAASFPNQMYFVASEHIARWRFTYKLIDFLVAPIMRYKGAVATSTVVDILKKVKKGANVCIFAEGARSWDGLTGPIAPSTAKLIQSSGCGLVTYKITGGYFVSPRWSTNLRRGHLCGAPVNVYTKEQLAEMTVEEIYSCITRDLHEDAYETQLTTPKRYRSRALAEHMESLLFICPQCGAHDTLYSQGDTVGCRACGLSFRYDEYGMLHGLSHKTMRDLSHWQTACVGEDVKKGTVYTAPDAILSEISKHQETIIDRGTLSISPLQLQCGNTTIPLDGISDLALHGKRGIVFTAGKKYYELKPSEHCNALKFMIYFEEFRK